MKIATVTGSVVSTLKNPEFVGYKLLLVTDTDLDGSLLGDPYIALDTVDAGQGDKVLINKEGGGARLLLDNPRIPVQAVIVGVVDDWHTE
ncbi:MAG: EutN/CcmL family microcompartment protein [Calditrichaeota bacterium]|nr:EutN/CcmL family microcompartment protein [Calditrichota bacterium]MCB9475099.1 EutN/CcmL family microcompartment protein [Candidatus Delongbacteria bacterium]